jgi:hypothetical protein
LPLVPPHILLFVDSVSSSSAFFSTFFTGEHKQRT